MKLNRIFTSGMVLPAGKPLRFYGEGKGKATISLAGVTRCASFDTDRWCLDFPELDYGGPYTLTAELDGEIFELSDVYVGEVYLFAGQSNMQFRLDQTNTPKQRWIPSDKLRAFCTDRFVGEDFRTPDDGWTVCDEDNVGLWSAIGYLVSSEISKKRGIAVGAVLCFRGATVIQSWVPAGTYEKIGINLAPEDFHVDHTHPEFKDQNRPGIMYDHALREVIPYPLSGIVWYQGESNTARNESLYYEKELTELIRLWRSDFCDDELPFVVVQIADTEIRLCDGWYDVQKAQLAVADKIPFVKTVISRDISERDDIHPVTKDKLSDRITEAVLSF